MKNWKTTLVGFLMAIYLVVKPIIETETFDLSKDYPNLIWAALVAVFALLAKDYNVTGTPPATKG